MATAKIDRVSLLECQEEDGAVVRLVTQARVIGITDTSPVALLSALAASGIPAAGSTPSGFTNLFLRQRNAKIVDADAGTVDVDLVYEKKSATSAPWQNFDAPADSAIVGEMTVDVQQVTTNLDGEGNQITVRHTFPSTDVDFPSQEITQGGEVTYYEPQRRFTVRGIKNTNRPWLLATAILGKVNESAWSSGGPREWLCVGARWDIHDRSGSNRHLMEFSFQHNPNTWDPTVVFIDNRSGKPPENLIENVGYKKVLILPQVAFEQVLGTRMQGG